MSDATSLGALIDAQGLKIRDLKTAKASPDAIKAEVSELLALKLKYKELTGSDYVAAGAVAAPAPAPKKKEAAPAVVVSKEKAVKKEEKATKVDVVAAPVELLDLNDLVVYTGPSGFSNDVLKIALVAQLFKKNLKVKETAPASVAKRVPFYPAMVVPSSQSSSGHTCKHGTVLFGAAAVCRYLADSAVSSVEASYLDMDELVLSLHLKSGSGADSRKSLFSPCSVLMLFHGMQREVER